MPQSSCPQARLSKVRAVTLALLFLSHNLAYVNAQDADVGDFETVHSDAIRSLKNSDVDWKGTSFGRAGPVIIGANAGLAGT